LNDACRAGAATALDVAITSKDYPSASGPQRVIEDLRLMLPCGAAGAVVGPSGCGKSTLLRIIAGLDTVFDGRVSLPAHGRLGMVFQEPRLLPWRTVYDNLRIVAPEASEAEIASLLSELGLEGHARHFPGQLSLGLARRVALGRALAIKPDLLLMDEPLVSLDARLAVELREKIARLIEEKRVTTLIVTHDLREAIHLADRVFLLSARPARIVATLEIPSPRARMTKSVAEDLERRAQAVLHGRDHV
jgi:ABC-type nitrate/sulfonate/bicarbonate transport system ATPase subunit